jgi:hypothetical protein
MAHESHASFAVMCVEGAVAERGRAKCPAVVSTLGWFGLHVLCKLLVVFWWDASMPTARCSPGLLFAEPRALDLSRSSVTFQTCGLIERPNNLLPVP